MKKIVEVLPDKTALIQRSLTVVLAKMQAAIGERGQCTIALAGGSTPKPLYEAMATQALPWEKIHVFWGDERYVPPDHPDSNQRMARSVWLDRVKIPEANIHALLADEADPALAARKHNDHLQTFFNIQGKGFPTLDLVLLGLGDDGHTASLFPHTAALQVFDRLVTVGSKEAQPRLTFTVPLINQARCVIFIVSGASKQMAITQVLSPENGLPKPGQSHEDLDETYPARLIQPQGELWWLLDKAAGEDIETGTISGE